jgi:hypothetical protein
MGEADRHARSARSEPPGARRDPGKGRPERADAVEPSRRWAESLGRPAGRVAAVGLAIAFCVLPASLMADPLWSFFLRADDFDYFGASRTWSRAIANLWVPHNAHVVPVFRLWTRVLFGLAGSWQNLHIAALSSCYGLLVVTLGVLFGFVRRETGRTDLGLAAMVGAGTTSLMLLPATWYAASQTLWAGLGILVTLAMLQNWRRHGAAGWLLAAALAAVAAAGSWSAGYIAGPVAVAYLWADGRARCRRAAGFIAALSALAALAMLGWKGRVMLSPEVLNGHTVADAFQPIRTLVHTLHAITETLCLGNLGIVAETTALQGVALALAGIALWLLARYRGAGGITPLESAGAAMIVLGFLLPYTFRGYLSFESLRTLRWYNTIPQLGAVLFGLGWWSGRSAWPAPAQALTRRAAIALVAFAALMSLVHVYPVELVLVSDAPPLLPAEKKFFPVFSLERLRAAYFAAERSERQRRFLQRMDQVEREAHRLGAGRATLQRLFGRLGGPGLLETMDGFDMLDLRDEATTPDATAVRRAIGPFVVEEPEPGPGLLYEPSQVYPGRCPGLACCCPFGATSEIAQLQNLRSASCDG